MTRTVYRACMESFRERFQNRTKGVFDERENLKFFQQRALLITTNSSSSSSSSSSARGKQRRSDKESVSIISRERFLIERAMRRAFTRRT